MGPLSPRGRRAMGFVLVAYLVLCLTFTFGYLMASLFIAGRD